MRIACIKVASRRGEALPAGDRLVKGMIAAGHLVDVFDAWVDDGLRLPGYEYVVVVARSTSFFGGKMPEALAKLLKTASSLVGKKAAAFFVKTSPFGTVKGLRNLMATMEREGMFINWSEIILGEDHAEALGKKIGS